jgi:hypothetical protein
MVSLHRQMKLVLKHPITLLSKIVECKKPHTIGQDLIKPCQVEAVSLD